MEEDVITSSFSKDCKKKKTNSFDRYRSTSEVPLCFSCYQIVAFTKCVDKRKVLIKDEADFFFFFFTHMNQTVHFE